MGWLTGARCLFAALSLSFSLPAQVPLVTMSLPLALPEYWHTFNSDLGHYRARPGVWRQVKDYEVVARFLEHEPSIASVYLYYPAEEITSLQPLVLWVVHGTWAQASFEYFDMGNKAFGEIAAFAGELAKRQRRPVELVSYRWSGQDTYEDRGRDGERLRLLMERFYSTHSGYGPQWALGHSHGVNVVWVASQKVAFDTVIAFGAPVLADVYTPFLVGTLYHFYSLNDPVQRIGAVDRRSLKKILFPRANSRTFSCRHPEATVYNLRTLINGKEPGHIGIKQIIPMLWRIIDRASAHYKYHTHLTVAVDLPVGRRDSPGLYVAIHEQIDLAVLAHSPAEVAEQGVERAHIDGVLSELVYSKGQEERFSYRHVGRKISGSSKWWEQFFDNWAELGALLREKIPFFNIGSYRRYSLFEEREPE